MTSGGIINNTSGSDNNNLSYLRNGNIIERFEIEVRVLMSQTSKVKKKKGCNFIKKSELKIGSKMPEIIITCHKNSECENYKNDICNFLCKWFITKNNFLFEEFATLSDNLNRQDYFYTSEVNIIIKAITNTEVSEEVFDYLREYVNKH